MVIRRLRSLAFAPDLISQLHADLLAVGCDKGLSESTIYPDHFAFRPQFGAFLLEDQFDPHSLPVHPETNRRAGSPAVAPKAIHIGSLVDRNRELRHSRSQPQGQIKSLSLELFDPHEAIVQRDDLATQQWHGLDLST